jgi:hypothetical protein
MPACGAGSPPRARAKLAESQARDCANSWTNRNQRPCDADADEAITALSELSEHAAAPEWLTIPPEELRDLFFEQVEGGILGDEVTLRPRHLPTVREFLRDFIVERAVVRPGRGPVEDRVQIEFKKQPLAA